MKPNIGMMNALVRITCGLTMLAWSTAKFSKRTYRESYVVIMLLAAMKVAEGIVRYCPVTALIQMGTGNNTKQEKESSLG